eukprot:scpid112400/ scgid19019/ 
MEYYMFAKPFFGILHVQFPVCWCLVKTDPNCIFGARMYMDLDTVRVLHMPLDIHPYTCSAVMLGTGQGRQSSPSVIANSMADMAISATVLHTWHSTHSTLPTYVPAL